MYTLKPIFDLDASVEVPSCMYRLPVIQQSTRIEGGVSPGEMGGSGCPPAALEALAARQDNILAKLEQLRKEVASFRASLGLPQASGQQEAAAPLPSGGRCDLVLQCPPSQPPHSLPLLCPLLSQAGVSLFTSSHCHSSLTKPLPKNLENFLPTTEVERSAASVRLTLIWTESCPEIQFMASPLSQVWVQGESNLLRHLSRNLSQQLPCLAYESLASDKLLKADRILDTAAQMRKAQPKQRLPLLKSVTGELQGASNFLIGNSLSVADFALCSVIKSLGFEKDLAPTTLKWFNSLGPAKPIKMEKSAEDSPKKDKASGKKQAGKENVPPVSDKSSSNNVKMGKEELFAYFKGKGIAFKNKDHPEVFTVETMMPYLTDVRGLVGKNLFLKDKKKNFYLLAARHDLDVNLAEVGKKVGVKDLRFADEASLYECLGVRQGCVSVYALVNDAATRRVTLLLDSALVADSCEAVSFHPLVNSATTTLSVGDFKKFLASVGHTIKQF